jgi:hypothetical protein
MICRHRLLLIALMLTVSTYFVRYYFLLHVLLLVYSVHLLHYLAHVISDYCIAFYVAKTTYNWFLAFCNEPSARCDGALEAPIRNLNVQPSL